LKVLNKKIDTTEREKYESIAKEIQSDDSPVGIDAKKTHIIIIQKLIQIEERLTQIEKRLK
jgi:hypothetical protein